ncbi:hypothetical protein J7J74_01850 [bacterium]|nr:hypothetical protein [bacterium]
MNNTDFINIGTYPAEQADILKSELEKQGIPVKVLYPGTNIGKETTAEAKWTAYTLLVRNCDLPIIQEIQKRIQIYPLRKIPLPKGYFSNTLRSRLLRVLFLVSGLILLIIGGILSCKTPLPSKTSIYLIVIGISLLLFWFISIGWEMWRFRSKT